MIDQHRFFITIFSFEIVQAFITQDSGDRDRLVKSLMPFDIVVINHVGGEGHFEEALQLSEEARIFLTHIAHC